MLWGAVRSADRVVCRTSAGARAGQCNVFARSIAGYRAELDDAAAEVLRLVRAV